MDQSAEIISGPKVIETLRVLIDSRRICRLDIPNTDYGWMTLLLAIEKTGGSQYVRIDQVAEFEKVFSHAQNQEVSVEFLEKGGIPLQFKTQVVKCLPEAIWVELPLSIHRIQKRAYYRIEALLGSEITLHAGPGKEEKAAVKDYSLGGVAFIMERHLKIGVNDQLTDITLTLAQGNKKVTIHIPSAVVKRVEPHTNEKQVVVAIEFLEMTETNREELWRHIFEEQRLLIRKIKRT
jgi:c-di-GMP-binding flagellar brake protein YcgR